MQLIGFLFEKNSEKSKGLHLAAPLIGIYLSEMGTKGRWVGPT